LQRRLKQNTGDCLHAGKPTGFALTVVRKKGSAMSMNVGNKKGSMADINITPYIDILLVLLIIFMVIVPVRQMDLDVKVPQPNPDKKTYIDPSVIVVDVGEFASITINQRQNYNDKQVTITSLGGILREIYSARAKKDMFIRAGAKLAYGDVVKVIDIAKGAGVGDIGLITEENE
jgi:biopolymer transport protein TolR